MDKFNEIKEIILGAEEDFEKFYEKENKAAGTRVRKAMQAAIKLAGVIRKDVQEKKNAM